MVGIGYMAVERAAQANSERRGNPEIGNCRKSAHPTLEPAAGVTWQKMNA